MDILPVTAIRKSITKIDIQMDSKVTRSITIYSKEIKAITMDSKEIKAITITVVLPLETEVILTQEESAWARKNTGH